VTYRVELTKRARRDLQSIQRPTRTRVEAAIRTLGDDPRPPKAKPLVGRPGWRIRIGDHRVIYEIEDDRLLVLVVRAGHRREVYR
jgi:mRNA interferase RelE/StbE